MKKNHFCRKFSPEMRKVHPLVLFLAPLFILAQSVCQNTEHHPFVMSHHLTDTSSTMVKPPPAVCVCIKVLMCGWEQGNKSTLMSSSGWIDALFQIFPSLKDVLWVLIASIINETFHVVLVCYSPFSQNIYLRRTMTGCSEQKYYYYPSGSFWNAMKNTCFHLKKFHVDWHETIGFFEVQQDPDQLCCT